MGSHPNIATVASIGLLRGNISFLNTVRCEAPSINALSSSSAGIDSMYVFTSNPKGLNIDNYLALKGVNDLGYAFIVTITRPLVKILAMDISSNTKNVGRRPGTVICHILWSPDIYNYS